MFIADLEVPVPVRMFPGGSYPILRYLESALFTGYPGKEYFMLDPHLVDHDHVHQVLIQ